VGCATGSNVNESPHLLPAWLLGPRTQLPGPEGGCVNADSTGGARSSPERCRRMAGPEKPFLLFLRQAGTAAGAVNVFRPEIHRAAAASCSSKYERRCARALLARGLLRLPVYAARGVAVTSNNAQQHAVRRAKSHSCSIAVRFLDGTGFWWVKWPTAQSVEQSVPHLDLRACVCSRRRGPGSQMTWPADRSCYWRHSRRLRADDVPLATSAWVAGMTTCLWCQICRRSMTLPLFPFNWHEPSRLRASGFGDGPSAAARLGCLSYCSDLPYGG